MAFVTRGRGATHAHISCNAYIHTVQLTVSQPWRLGFPSTCTDTYCIYKSVSISTVAHGVIFQVLISRKMVTVHLKAKRLL
eukprot:1161540-Pelagomonas_calceolata.AAC.25